MSGMFGTAGGVLAYHRGVCFLVVDHMLPKRLLFVLWTPFVRGNVWSVTVCTSWLSRFFTRASLVCVVSSADNYLLLKKNLHPRVKVDQACRPLPPKKSLAF